MKSLEKSESGDLIGVSKVAFWHLEFVEKMSKLGYLCGLAFCILMLSLNVSLFYYTKKDHSSCDEKCVQQLRAKLNELLVAQASENSSRYSVFLDINKKAKIRDTQEHRGIVIPIYDGNFFLGLSLIRFLRCLGNEKPVEVAHCTPAELSSAHRQLLLNEKDVTLNDVCQHFESEKTKKKYKGYWVKPLAVYYSRFDQVMMFDVDTLFAQDPDILWDIEGYQKTGTLFFHDRYFKINKFLTRKVNYDNKKETMIKNIVRVFNREPFEKYDSVGDQEVSNLPSKQLEKSSVWNGETAHYQDSSVVLFHRKKQQRALEIMYYIATKLRFQKPFSWGDKEAFFLSCELANSEYYFSPWGIGAISHSNDMKNHPGTLCGNMVHYVPSSDNEMIMYTNGVGLIVPDSPIRTKKEVYFYYDPLPTHVSPPQVDGPYMRSKHGIHCISKGKGIPLEKYFYNALFLRRLIYQQVSLSVEITVNCHAKL